jgi:hypothetical protein
MISAPGPPVNPRRQLSHVPNFPVAFVHKPTAEFAARMSPKAARWASVASGVVAAAALAFATQLPWWSFAEVEVFLTRARHCFEGECRRTGLDWLGVSDWWHRLATAAFGVGLFTALIAVFVAGARAAGRVPRTAAGSLLVAVICSLGCGAATLSTFPQLGQMHLGVGPLLYIVGLIAAAVAALLARRAIAEAVLEPAAAADSPAPAADSPAAADSPPAAS